MAVNVEIKRNQNENNISVIKRFTRKTQESGVLNTVKKRRFASRSQSPYNTKKKKLKNLEKKANYEKKQKLGTAPLRKKK